MESLVSKDKEILIFSFSKKKKKERVFHRWRINTVKGRETAGQLYTLVFQDDYMNTSHERVYLMLEIGDTVILFSSFLFRETKNEREAKNSMEVVRESKVLTRSTTRYRS